MSRREKGTYVVLDRRVVAYTKTHWDASSGVLTALAEQANYADPVMKVAQLMLETDLGQRAVEKCLTRLETAGLAVRSGNGWAYPRANQGANGEANQDANHHANSGANDGSRVDTENDVQHELGEAPKEVEGIQGSTEQTPPPPQGDQGEGSAPAQDQLQTPTPARTRRAPTPPPRLPADLAEVPGLPLAWEKWLRYRAQASIKTTESTAEEQFRKLRALGQAGEDLPAAVARAIEFGWKSFFPSKDRPTQRAAPPAAQTSDDPTPSMAELLASAPLHPQRKVS